MSAPFATPAPDDVQAELLLYLDAYSESLDHGLARYFGIEPLGLAGAPIVALKSAAAWTFLQKEGPGHEGHVDPANAIPIDLPLADPIVLADIQHQAWSMVREGNVKLKEQTVPIADLLATQEVVDKERVASDEARYRERGDEQGDYLPLVLEYEGQFAILSGHHHAQAVANAGAREMRVQVMTGSP